jgi:hypothetical protein
MLPPKNRKVRLSHSLRDGEHYLFDPSLVQRGVGGKFDRFSFRSKS